MPLLQLELELELELGPEPCRHPTVLGDNGELSDARIQGNTEWI